MKKTVYINFQPQDYQTQTKLHKDLKTNESQLGPDDKSQIKYFARRTIPCPSELIGVGKTCYCIKTPSKQKGNLKVEPQEKLPISTLVHSKDKEKMDIDDDVQSTTFSENKHCFLSKKRERSISISKESRSVVCCESCKWEYPEEMINEERQCHEKACVDKQKGKEHKQNYLLSKAFVIANSMQGMKSINLEGKKCVFCNTILTNRKIRNQSHLVNCAKSYSRLILKKDI